MSFNGWKSAQMMDDVAVASTWMKAKEVGLEVYKLWGDCPEYWKWWRYLNDFHVATDALIESQRMLISLLRKELRKAKEA